MGATARERALPASLRTGKSPLPMTNDVRLEIRLPTLIQVSNSGTKFGHRSGLTTTTKLTQNIG